MEIVPVYLVEAHYFSRGTLKSQPLYFCTLEEATRYVSDAKEEITKLPPHHRRMEPRLSKDLLFALREIATERLFLLGGVIAFEPTNKKDEN
jgi:hypothetical protein